MTGQLSLDRFEAVRALLVTLASFLFRQGEGYKAAVLQ